MGNGGALDQQPIAEFRSIETVDPSTLTLYPNRVELGGSGREVPRVLALDEIVKVKVRTLLSVSTVLIRSASGDTLVADLFLPADARAARDLVEELRAAPPAEIAVEPAPTAA
jgi:hypothetical protein